MGRNVLALACVLAVGAGVCGAAAEPLAVVVSGKQRTAQIERPAAPGRGSRDAAPSSADHASAARNFQPTFDADVDRPGGGMYHRFEPADPSARHCQVSCIADMQCRSWAYSPPAAAGGHAFCWLRNVVPSPVGRPAFASGIVRP